MISDIDIDTVVTSCIEDILVNLEDSPLPLGDTWVVWEHTDDKANYDDNIRQICDFNTVQKFWTHVTYIPLPSMFFSSGKVKRKLIGGRSVVSYSIFKEGIEPKWEDRVATKGGEWRIRRFRSILELSDIWMDIILALIGGVLEPRANIIGIRVVDSSHSHKSLYNIEIWSDTIESLQIIKTSLKTALPMVDVEKMYLRNHKT